MPANVHKLPTPSANADYVIDKNVPVPTRSPYSKYPFGAMAVGDSFFYPGPTSEYVRNAAHHWGKNNGAKFSVRKDDGGYRCWRIA